MKKMMVILFILLGCSPYICRASEIEQFTGDIQTYVGGHSDSDIKWLSEKADLIFEGQCTAIVQFLTTKGSFIDARAQHGIKYHNVDEMLRDLPWLVTFKVDKILKGKLPEGKSTYNVLIHSPGTTFGLDIGKNSKGSEKKYKIYVKLFSEKAQGELEENILLAGEPINVRK